MRRAPAAVVATTLALAAEPGSATAASVAACRAGSTPMARVELYFGEAPRADGHRAWTRFLADVVTPRFPDGLTCLDGQGQWRGLRGLTREPAHVLIIFYRPDATSDTRIEAIRDLYKRRFKQLSVLRADSSACVSF